LPETVAISKECGDDVDRLRGRLLANRVSIHHHHHHALHSTHAELTSHCGHSTIFMLWGNTAYCAELTPLTITHARCRHAPVPLRKNARYDVELGLPRLLEYSSATRVVNYSSYFLLFEFSLISISGCKFPFLVAVFCSHLTNCWNLCKLGASRFHLQHASLEMRG